MQDEVFNHKGKLKYKTTFTYDDKHQIASLNTYKGNGKFNMAWKYNYNEKGFIKKLVKVKNKNKQLEEINYSYTYYN